MNEIKIFGNDIICVLRATILGGGEKRSDFFYLKIIFFMIFLLSCISITEQNANK